MRVKRGVAHVKRRKNLLKKVKGFRWKRKSSIRLARQASTRAGQHAYRHRKLRKRDFRALWQIRIGAAAKQNGMSYSQFMHKVHLAKIEVDRKILADLAATQPDAFKAIVDLVK